jgi:hypothetical protein
MMTRSAGISIVNEARRETNLKNRKINRVSEDFSTFELEYKGKIYNTVSSGSKEMYRYFLSFISCANDLSLFLTESMRKKLAK